MLNVYLHEFNVRMGKFRYLPIVSGILKAYCETSELIRKHYRFMPFLYEMDSVPDIWHHYSDPVHVAAFSVSMWNEQLCLEVARKLKEEGDPLIIFGGYSVPHHATEYMEKYPFIDVCIRGEGEDAFKSILEHIIDQKCPSYWFGDVPAVSYRNNDYLEGLSIVENHNEWPFEKDLDKFPSAYLTGQFDNLLRDRTEDRDFQAIIETNRGCSFPCSFCAWGRGGLTTRYRFHSMGRVKAEIDWCGQNKIPYLFNADSNFGMHPRDQEIAEYLVATKRKYSFPDKFRTCFGKNTDDKIFKAATTLHAAGLEKGVTLARQSNDETTLKNIRRQNISLDTYRGLQERFNDTGIPVYVELILGLPGETLESWKKGIDDCLTKAGSKNSLFVYLCQVLPNTEMADPEYQKKHGIRTKHIELQEIHGSPRGEGWVKELEEIVIATASMPYDQWKKACKYSWATMVMHSMKTGFFVLAWLWDRFKIPPSEFIPYHSNPKWDELIAEMSVFGNGRGQVLPEYGSIYWDVEEADLLKLSEKWPEYYMQLGWSVDHLLYEEKQVDYMRDEMKEVVAYQHYRMPSFCPMGEEHRHPRFAYNVPEYFDKLFTANPVPLVKKPQVLTLKPKTYASKEQFARETILYGRKSGTLLVPCEWKDA